LDLTDLQASESFTASKRERAGYVKLKGMYAREVKRLYYFVLGFFAVEPPLFAAPRFSPAAAGFFEELRIALFL